jgi:SAM-dependent methyltransferase
MQHRSIIGYGKQGDLMDLSAATDFFDPWYRAGGTSGPGSTASVSTPYRHVVEEFIRLNDVHTVLEVGCGDWVVSSLIPWHSYNISYLGLDVSPFIIEMNTNTFGNEHRRFNVIREPSEILGLGRFDLILSKDALHHMPNGVVSEYLDAFVAVGRHCLLTNDVGPYNLNGEIDAGGWRTLDFRKPPFSRNSTVIAEYVNFDGPNYWVKHVHLLTGATSR